MCASNFRLQYAKESKNVLVGSFTYVQIHIILTSSKIMLLLFCITNVIKSIFSILHRISEIFICSVNRNLGK
jgi:hypothetical protein